MGVDNQLSEESNDEKIKRLEATTELLKSQFENFRRNSIVEKAELRNSIEKMEADQKEFNKDLLTVIESCESMEIKLKNVTEVSKILESKVNQLEAEKEVLKNVMS